MSAVAVVGADGYVGRALVSALAEAGHKVTGVRRADYAQCRQQSYDVLVNAAMPSGRFWAKQHPTTDFEETVRKTAALLYEWRYRRFVQISTLSARCQLDTVYGRHKAAAEVLCGHADHLIVRLGPMYSDDLSKGILVDLLQQRPVFVDASSRYCFAPRDFVTAWIAANLERTGLVEVGARDAIPVGKLADDLGIRISFTGPVDHQEIECPGANFPPAGAVLDFLTRMRERQHRAAPADPPESSE